MEQKTKMQVNVSSKIGIKSSLKARRNSFTSNPCALGSYIFWSHLSSPDTCVKNRLTLSVPDAISPTNYLQSSLMDNSTTAKVKYVVPESRIVEIKLATPAMISDSSRTYSINLALDDDSTTSPVALQAENLFSKKKLFAMRLRKNSNALKQLNVDKSAASEWL